MKKKFYTPFRGFGRKAAAIVLLQAAVLSPAFAADYSVQEPTLQKTMVSLSFSHASLKDFIKKVEAQTPFRFTFDENEVLTKGPISIKAANEPLEDILERVSEEAGLEFKQVNNNIHIRLRHTSAPQGSRPATAARAAADVTVTGKVVDETGAGLPGVTVLLKGTSLATGTSADGSFSLLVPENGTLVFSFIGYQSQEIAVNGKTTFNVSLQPDTKALEEVVVIGYGTQQKKDLTTAVAVVSTKDIEERPIVQVAAALQGKAAGVQVSQPTGKPGAGLSVRVRGATSVQAGNEPLYVIDGVPTPDSRDLNPNDIESIQVLKDASSAAIYGARAANGVVIITTKRGKANSSSINFNAYYGISNLSKKIDVLNPEQYNALMTEMGFATETDGQTTNWMDQVFQTGHNQNYQLSFSGGSEKSQYYVSGAYTMDEGMVRPAQYKRYAFRANLDNQVKDWLKLTTNINYSNAGIKDVKDNAGAGRNAVVLGALNAPPTIGIYETDEQGRTRFTMNPNKSGWDNPMGAIEGPTQGTADNRVFGNAVAELTPLKNIKLRSNFGIDYFNHKQDYYLDYIMTTEGRNNHGLAQSEKSNSFTYLWENTAHYDNNWGKHNLSALAGVTVQQNNWNNSYISGRDFPEDPTVKTLNAANIIDYAATSESQWFLNSYLGRVSYNYDSRYLLTANFRADGSSKLDAQNRWGFFPSVSAGWRVSAEPFMQSITAINDLKLRAGWGQNGNQEGIANYASYGLNSFSRRAATDPLSGPAITPPNYAPNPDLKWETTTQSNVGVDLSLLDSRITFTADAYIKKTNDLLLNVALPTTADYDYITRNSGKMENKGLEFVLSTVNLDKPDFTWTSDFNISFNRNRITELELAEQYRYAAVEGRDQIIILQEGLPLGAFYGYVADGVDPATGDMIYRDLTGEGNITPQDRTIIGNAQPDFTYGLNNDLKYKNWGFSFLFQGSQGNEVFNASRIETEGLYDSKNQSTEVLRRWTTPGQVTDIPRVAPDGNVYNSRISSRFVEDGSFLRLKSATLSYSLPTSFADKVNLNRFQLYVTAQNLFTLTKYKGFDPEVNAFSGNAPTLGIDYGTYPQAKAFIFGLNVQL